MDRREEIAALERKLAARRDRPGFQANVAGIEARIAQLKAEESANGG
jgi:hypothetical protein